MHATPLEARVAAINAANAHAMKIRPKLLDVFRPLVGQKIMKVDGTLTAKATLMVPDLPNSVSLSVYRLRSEYSLAWVVKACETYPDSQGIGHSAVYSEATVYVGDLRDGVLTSISDLPLTLRTDYTADEAKAKRAAYAAAKKAADNARSDLYPFEEYDR